MSAASDEFPPPEDEPTRALLLAQALDMCISAERRLPGSADHIIAHQPSWARQELRRLVSLAGSLDAVATSAVMDDDFREAARSRLLQRIGGVLRNGAYSAAAENRWGISTFPSTNGYHVPVRRARKRRWLWRAGAGGVLAAALGTAATLTASATALPGEPLYQIKQAQEEIGLRFAPDDQALAFALLNQGDARLNETARLLQAGRTGDIALTTRRFDEAIDRATTTFVVTVVDTPAEAPATTSIETKLNAQQAQLESLIVSAPEPARADLRQALMATARGLALVANTQADQSVDRSTSGLSSVAAAVPTTLAESIPTVEPPTVVEAPPRMSSGVAADKHDANATVVDPPRSERATAAQTPGDAMQAPTAPQVAVNRPARGGLAVPATNHRDRSRSSSSDDQEDEQHFEPVATDSSVIAQVPQVSQQSAPRHMDITLSGNSDSAPASVQSDARHDDERQVAMPSTQADDQPQMAEQPQPAITHAQSPTESARTTSGDEASANSTAQTQNTSNAGHVQASTNSGDQHASSGRSDAGKSSKGDSATAVPSSSSSSHGGGSGDDHSGKTSGGGDQGSNSQSSKGGGDQNGKGGSDGGHGGNGGHGD